MAKTKNGRGEIEFLRGEVRRLKSELKYYKRRDHLNDVEEEFVDVDPKVVWCTQCGKGVLTEYDFKFASLIKCNVCNFEQKKSKKTF